MRKVVLQRYVWDRERSGVKSLKPHFFIMPFPAEARLAKNKLEFMCYSYLFSYFRNARKCSKKLGHLTTNRDWRVRPAITGKHAFGMESPLMYLNTSCYFFACLLLFAALTGSLMFLHQVSAEPKPEFHSRRRFCPPGGTTEYTFHLFNS